MHMLIPLWVALSLLGWTGNGGTSLGMTPDQIQDAYIVYDVPPLVSKEPIDKYAGFACVEGYYSPTFHLACSALPPKTIVVRVRYWPQYDKYMAYMIRHEMEHIIRGVAGVGPDGEIAAKAAGCVIAFWDWITCGDVTKNNTGSFAIPGYVPPNSTPKP